MTSIGIYQILFFFCSDPARSPSRWASSWRGCSRASAHSCIRVLRPLERLIYRLSGVREDVEQRWTQYAGVAPGIQHRRSSCSPTRSSGCRAVLPLNPQGFGAQRRCTPSDLAFNTAVSFMTNTNWQS